MSNDSFSGLFWHILMLFPSYASLCVKSFDDDDDDDDGDDDDEDDDDDDDDDEDDDIY